MGQTASGVGLGLGLGAIGRQLRFKGRLLMIARKETHAQLKAVKVLLPEVLRGHKAHGKIVEWQLVKTGQEVCPSDS